MEIGFLICQEKMSRQILDIFKIWLDEFNGPIMSKGSFIHPGASSVREAVLGYLCVYVRDLHSLCNKVQSGSGSIIHSFLSK